MKEYLTREIVAVVNQPTESATAWIDIFKNVKERGIESVGPIVSDNLTGKDNSITKEFSIANHQLCCVHLMRSLSSKVSSKQKAKVLTDFKAVLDVQKPNNNKRYNSTKLSVI